MCSAMVIRITHRQVFGCRSIPVMVWQRHSDGLTITIIAVAACLKKPLCRFCRAVMVVYVWLIWMPMVKQTWLLLAPMVCMFLYLRALLQGHRVLRKRAFCRNNVGMNIQARKIIMLPLLVTLTVMAKLIFIRMRTLLIQRLISINSRPSILRV